MYVEPPEGEGRLSDVSLTLEANFRALAPDGYLAVNLLPELLRYTECDLHHIST